MKKSQILAALILALAGVIASAPAHADFAYTFNLPVINPDGSMTGGTAQFSIDYTDAYGQPDADFVSQTPGASALSGGSYNSDWTTSAFYDPPQPDDIVPLSSFLLEYSEPAGSAYTILSFSFIEPLTFWDTPGEDVAFDDDGVTVFDSALALFFVPPTFNGGVNGVTNLGASYELNNVDPPCSTCSVTITATPAAATPEPSSFLLLASGLVGLAGMATRKLRA